MGNSRQQTGDHSKFTPTGNEQGSTAVQPDGQDRTPDSREPEQEDVQEDVQDGEHDKVHHEQQGDAPGLFSTLVGNGKDS